MAFTAAALLICSVYSVLQSGSTSTLRPFSDCTALHFSAVCRLFVAACGGGGGCGSVAQIDSLCVCLTHCVCSTKQPTPLFALFSSRLLSLSLSAIIKALRSTVHCTRRQLEGRQWSEQWAALEEEFVPPPPPPPPPLVCHLEIFVFCLFY